MYNKSLPRHLKCSNTDSIFRVDASQDDVDDDDVVVVVPPEEVEEEGLREMCTMVFSSVGLGLLTGSPMTMS